MPSDYARVRRDIWGDRDWRKLTLPAQWLYLHLLSSPTLTLCGVADWRPGRIAALADGMTSDDVTAISRELIEAEFILTDPDTEEVCIRSWVKHDGLITNGNMSKALAKAWSGTASEPIRALIVGQLLKMHDSDPTSAGWSVLGDLLAAPSMSFEEALAEVFPRGFEISPEAPPQAPREGASKRVGKGLSEGLRNSCPTPTPTPTPTPNSLLQLPSKNAAHPQANEPPAPSESFDTFWKAYPRKVGKGAAEKAWTKALKVESGDVIVARLTEQLPALHMQKRPDGDYRPHPATWLNEKRWQDDLEAAPRTDARHIPNEHWDNGGTFDDDWRNP